MIMISSNFIFNFTNFCVIVSFLTKILISSILSSTAVRAVVVAIQLTNSGPQDIPMASPSTCE